MTESTLREALEELVTLKEMKNRIDGMANIDVELLTKEQRVFHLDYMRRKPLAWEAARLALFSTANADDIQHRSGIERRTLRLNIDGEMREQGRKYRFGAERRTPDSRGEGFPYNTRVGAERRRK